MSTNETNKVENDQNEELEILVRELKFEKTKFVELNSDLTDAIYKYQRNTNLGFYLFLSTALVCITYLLK